MSVRALRNEECVNFFEQLCCAPHWLWKKHYLILYYIMWKQEGQLKHTIRSNYIFFLTQTDVSIQSAEILSPSFYLRNFSRKFALICGIIMLITIITSFGLMMNALQYSPREPGQFYRCLISISQLIVALAVIWVVNQYSKFGKTIRENRRRMANVFAYCGSIDKLILLRLDRWIPWRKIRRNDQDHCSETLRVVRNTLSDIPIRHLTMVTKKDDAHLRLAPLQNKKERFLVQSTSSLNVEEVE